MSLPYSKFLNGFSYCVSVLSKYLTETTYQRMDLFLLKVSEVSVHDHHWVPLVCPERRQCTVVVGVHGRGDHLMEARKERKGGREG
jgi:hypothetical protein